MQIPPMPRGSVEDQSYLLYFLQAQVTHPCSAPGSLGHHSVAVYWTPITRQRLRWVSRTWSAPSLASSFPVHTCTDLTPNTLWRISNSTESTLHYLPVVCDRSGVKWLGCSSCAAMTTDRSKWGNPVSKGPKLGAEAVSPSQCDSKGQWTHLLWHTFPRTPPWGRSPGSALTRLCPLGVALFVPQVTVLIVFRISTMNKPSILAIFISPNILLNEYKSNAYLIRYKLK